MNKKLRSLLIVVTTGLATWLVISAIPPNKQAGHVHEIAELIAPSPVVAAEAEVQKYTCGMHPMIITDEPGLCPICNMELTPLKPGGDTEKPAGEQ